MQKEKQPLAFRLKSYVSEFRDCSGPVFTSYGKIYNDRYTTVRYIII